jgi:hypothetical protein
MAHPDRLPRQRPADETPVASGPSPATAESGPAGEAPGPADPDVGGPGTTLAALAGDVDAAQRRRLLRRFAGELRPTKLTGLFRPRAALRWMVDSVVEIGPHVPIRDRATLRRHFPGLDDEQLAERLIRNATRATAGIGAAGGGMAAVKWAAPPTLLSAPVLLAVETVAVVGVELKLIGELHELYGRPLPARGAQRAVALIQAWSEQRGVRPLTPGVGVGAVLGTAARRELGELLLKRLGRNLTSLGPFLTGALAASYVNARATRSTGERMREELRGQRVLGDGRPGSTDGTAVSVDAPG